MNGSEEQMVAFRRCVWGLSVTLAVFRKFLSIFEDCPELYNPDTERCPKCTYKDVLWKPGQTYLIIQNRVSKIVIK